MASYPGTIYAPTTITGSSARTPPTGPAEIAMAVQNEIQAIETALGTNLANVSKYTVVTVTATHTTALGEITIATSGTFTDTLPAPVAQGACAVVNYGTGSVTVHTPSGTLYDLTGTTGNQVLAQGNTASYIGTASAWYRIDSSGSGGGSTGTATALQTGAADPIANTAPAANQVLAWSGTAWTPTTPAGGQLDGGTASSIYVFSDTIDGGNASGD